MELESSQGCLYDNLTIISGANSDATSLLHDASMCASSLEDVLPQLQKFTTSSRFLQVKFLADMSKTAKGFQLEVQVKTPTDDGKKV